MEQRQQHKESLAEEFSITANNDPVPEVNIKDEKVYADSEAALNETLRKLQLENNEHENIINLRKILSVIVTIGVFLWMFFVGSVIVCVACGCFNAKLSDTVLLSLIGGSTANILGMMTIILIFLFPPKHHKN